jgi:hypothetical protein
MKAMTWLKIGGGVLVALAAIAAADTRRIEVAEKAPEPRMGRVIASSAECQVASEQKSSSGGCCQKKAEQKAEPAQHSGCCRK